MTRTCLKWAHIEHSKRVHAPIAQFIGSAGRNDAQQCGVCLCGQIIYRHRLKISATYQNFGRKSSRKQGVIFHTYFMGFYRYVRPTRQTDFHGLVSRENERQQQLMQQFRCIRGVGTFFADGKKISLQFSGMCPGRAYFFPESECRAFARLRSEFMERTRCVNRIPE